MKKNILFLCPHNAAKSVIAAAYCQQLAIKYGIDLQISTAGTEPDDTVSPIVVARLEAEGLAVSGQIPRRVTFQDLAQANWIVSMGCNLEQLALAEKKVLQWDDIPPPSQDINGACQVIRDRVTSLIADLHLS
jgi:arsenate reductase (thioredoxin)